MSSTQSFDGLCSIPQVEEWLDTYKYSIKLCPSKSKEMMQIGALCPILLSTGNKVSLKTLLKSIPASTGMSRPQLFQHLEPNISGVVTMVTFQKQDIPLVLARQNSLEVEIRQIIVDGKEDKLFIDTAEGIWFGGVSKTKTGHILATQQGDRTRLA
jgi:hypothetical protein